LQSKTANTICPGSLGNKNLKGAINDFNECHDLADRSQ
jgi:hypothetical protein